MAKLSEGSRVEEASVESSAPAVEWAAIIAGAVAAVAVSLILFALGTGFGFAAVSPATFSTTSPAEFALSAGLWLIVVQWLAAGLGGYLTGRMRTKWVGIRTDEVFFRDTAHGFLAWALATLIVAGLLALGSGAAGAAASAATAGTPEAPSPEMADQARQAAAGFSFYTALSLLIGAFIGCVAGALGGFHRDEA
jgi:hypothetical protein